MERAWGAIPLAVAMFAVAFIGWMIRMLQLSWVRNDSWGFTLTVASVVIPIFLVYLWLAIYVLWGIAREGRGAALGTGPGACLPPACAGMADRSHRQAGDGHAAGLAPLPQGQGKEGRP